MPARSKKPRKLVISVTDIQKTSLVNFKHKNRTSANYTDGIGTGYTSHNKKYVCTVKYLKTTSKSINQIRPILMP